MICPKCNEEYRDGFTKCTDCNVDLVDKKEIIVEKWSIGSDGIRLIKLGFILLFISFAELIIVVLSYEFYIAYRQAHGFMMDYIFVFLVNPIIWYIFAIEVVISIVIVVWGVSFRIKNVIKKSV